MLPAAVAAAMCVVRAGIAIALDLATRLPSAAARRHALAALPLPSPLVDPTEFSSAVPSPSYPSPSSPFALVALCGGVSCGTSSTVTGRVAFSARDCDGDDDGGGCSSILVVDSWSYGGGVGDRWAGVLVMQGGWTSDAAAHCRVGHRAERGRVG